MKTLLSKKWLGPIALLFITLFISAFGATLTSNILREIVPHINQRVNNFLPIAIQNGEIIQTQNTLISETLFIPAPLIYHDSPQIENVLSIENIPVKIVLDTRSDTLDLSSLSDVGVYFSRKCVHSVLTTKSVDCFKNDINGVLDKDIIQTTYGYIKGYITPVLACILTISLFFVFYAIILFYTALLHWFIALFYKTTFWQTLYINTFAFIPLMLIAFFTTIKIGFLLTIVLLLLINLLICKTVNERKKKS